MATVLASTALATVAALHFLWAAGSSWPLKEPADLTGLPPDQAPGPVASAGVGGLLAVAASLAGGSMQRNPVGKLARILLTLILLVRGLAGVGGKTDKLVGWSTSERFKRLDRRVYGPFCLAVAVCLALSQQLRSGRNTLVD